MSLGTNSSPAGAGRIPKNSIRDKKIAKAIQNLTGREKKLLK
jgi:hypothetical protein